MAGHRVILISFNGYKLEIPSNPYPMYPHVERLNCVSIDSASGQRYVFDGGPTRVNACIVWKSLDHEFVKKYEHFLLNVAKLGKVMFGIRCPDYIDLGNGMGEDIIEAYYAGPPSTKDIITPRDDAGLHYDIELPYMYVRSV